MQVSDAGLGVLSYSARVVHSKESPVTGESFEQSLKRLREETNAVLIDGIIHTIAIVLSIVGVLALGDLQIHRPYVVALYVQKVLLFLVGVGVAIALHGPATRRWPRCFGLLFLGAAAVSCAVQGAITGDAVMPAPLLMMLTLGTACLLPWGALPQAALACITAIALVGNGYAVTGTFEGAVGVPLFTAALTAFAASVFLSHFFERQRLAWRAQGIRLQAKSGAWIWVRSHGRTFEVEGKFAGLRGTVTDVTERKRAELERTAVLEVARDIGGTLDVGEILDRLHTRVAAALPCDFVFTFCWSAERNAFVAAGQYGCPP